LLRGERETLLCQKYVRILSDNAGLVSPLDDGLAGQWWPGTAVSQKQAAALRTEAALDLPAAWAFAQFVSASDSWDRFVDSVSRLEKLSGQSACIDAGKFSLYYRS